MSPDRRAVRRQETKDEIIAAAWDLVRQQGLAGLALRDLAQRVGMKAPSLYSYFASKSDIYDVMFREGYLAFAAEHDDLVVEPDRTGADGATVLRRMAHRFFEFCTSDPARYQLLFQRTIPEFVPSEESYAVALDVYGRLTSQLAALGFDDPQTIDLWTALLTGLTDQQISNDPGGTRWEGLVDRAVDMFIVANAPHLLEATTRGSTP